MTYKKREWWPGVVLHITARGNHRNESKWAEIIPQAPPGIRKVGGIKKSLVDI